MSSIRLTAAALFALGAARTALASPCVSFDANWNLLAFGLGGKDWNAGEYLCLSSTALAFSLQLIITAAPPDFEMRLTDIARRYSGRLDWQYVFSSIARGLFQLTYILLKALLLLTLPRLVARMSRPLLF